MSEYREFAPLASNRPFIFCAKSSTRDSETLTELVVYRALYDSDEFGPNALWVRPKTEFLASVQFNGQTMPRFKFIPS